MVSFTNASALNKGLKGNQYASDIKEILYILYIYIGYVYFCANLSLGDKINTQCMNIPAKRRFQWICHWVTILYCILHVDYSQGQVTGHNFQGNQRHCYYYYNLAWQFVKDGD